MTYGSNTQSWGRRQTGRTARMLGAVRELAKTGKNCVVIGADQHESIRLLTRFRRLCAAGELDSQSEFVKLVKMANGTLVYFMSRASFTYLKHGLTIPAEQIYWDHAATLAEHFHIIQEFHRWD